MPTSNFLQFNPSQANQESDSAYNGDSVRAGGAPVNGIFVSALANKLFYQLSTMVAAIASYLNGQGQNAQDGNLAVLATAIQAAIANQIAKSPSIVAVAFSPTEVFDASQGVNFETTLTGNVGSSNLINTQGGQRLVFAIHQDATGGRTFAWPTNVLGGGTVDPTANATSTQEFFVGGDGNARAIGPMVVT